MESAQARRGKRESKSITAGQTQVNAPSMLETKRSDARAEARAKEKKKAAAKRKEILSGLSSEDKSEVTSFMGSVNAKARDTLQEVVGLIASSSQYPQRQFKKVLVHAIANLDIDRSVSLLETMFRLGQDATMELLWLYERYNVPNASGGMTKCRVDHFGRDVEVGKADEILGMTEKDKEALVLKLAAWESTRKVKVMRAWEATDPAMSGEFLLELIREEQVRGDGPGNLWQCSLCPVKRAVEVGAKMKRGEHRRKDRTLDAGPIYGYDSESRGCLDIYRSPSESLFEFFSPKINISSAEGGKKDGERGRPGSGGRGRNSGVSGVLETCDSNASIAAGTVQASNLACFITSPPREEKREKLLHRGKTVCGPMSPTKGSTVVPPPNMQQEEGMVISYAGKGFDPRRMCTACTKELRGAIISSGHGLELWHTVDHERRALLMGQRQHDLLKARWAARERGERQVSEILRLICEANLDAFSRRSLEERARAVRDLQAAEIRRVLDLKLSDMAAVKRGATIDVGMKRLNGEEAVVWAATLRLKASLNMDRHYASLEPGGLPASLRRRHKTSTHPSDFLVDGTPATLQGAKQTFGRADPPESDEREQLRLWKDATRDAEELLDRRREVREWQSSYGRQARFSYLCGRWVDGASNIEEKQRQKQRIEAAEREKRILEREAAKLKRKLQLGELRADASVRATGEERLRVERDKEAETRERSERDELERMRKEEAAQLEAGDRFWGLVCEIQRLRAIEEGRRIAWEARIRATREKMVAVRCISELSSFSRTTPPKDPELAHKIDLLASM